MTPWRALALRWTFEVEDDLGDPAGLRVFVPSIMGAGILASLAVLVADAVRALDPRTRAARRRTELQRRALTLVRPVAEAIGVPPPSLPPLRRRLRSRRFYADLSLFSVSFSVYVAIGSTANYLRPGGYLEGVLWVQVVAVAASVFFFRLGVVAAVVALRHPVPPRWARAVIDHSPLGTFPK